MKKKLSLIILLLFTQVLLFAILSNKNEIIKQNNKNIPKKNLTIEDYEKMDIFEYMQLPDEQLNIGIAALILSKEIYTNIKFSPYLLDINRMVKQIKKLIGIRKDPESCIFRFILPPIPVFPATPLIQQFSS